MAVFSILLSFACSAPCATWDEQYERTTVVVVADDAEYHDPKTNNAVLTAERGETLSRRKIDGEWVEGVSMRGLRRFRIKGSAVIPFTEAYDFYTARLKQKPQAADHADRAEIHAFRGEHDEAIKDLDEAIRLDSTMVRAYRRRADAYSGKALAEGDPGIKVEYARRALVDAEHVLVLAPNDSESYFARALAYVTLDVNRAMADFAKVIELDPLHASARNNLAKHLIDMGKDDVALVRLNRAIKLCPDYSDAYTNRGIIYHRRKQFDKAIADATKAVEFNPRNVSAWNNRGNAYLETKVFDKAIEDFTECTRISPQSSDGYFGRANVYFTMAYEAEESGKRQGDGEKSSKMDDANKALYEKARADCLTALAKNPRDYKCRNTLGNVLKKLNQPKQAIETFDKAVELMTKEARDYGWQIVERLMEVDRFDADVQAQVLTYPHCGTLAAIFGNRADAYRILFEAGDESAREKMFDDLTRAVHFDPKNADYVRVRGFLYLKSTQFKQAYSDLNTALQLQPDNADLLRGFVYAAVELKKFDDAWFAADRLEALGMPLNDAELKQLRERSGRKE